MPIPDPHPCDPSVPLPRTRLLLFSSDLGDPAAVPIALAGLRDKSKLVRWRAARVVGELGVQERDADLLDEARGTEAEFEVAFEMADAARKIRSRLSGEKDGPGAGPVWKQIQERGSIS